MDANGQGNAQLHQELALLELQLEAIRNGTELARLRRIAEAPSDFHDADQTGVRRRIAVLEHPGRRLALEDRLLAAIATAEKQLAQHAHPSSDMSPTEVADTQALFAEQRWSSLGSALARA